MTVHTSLAEATEPQPQDIAEQTRWAHTRLRRRILYGLWREDLRQRIRLEMRSTERANAHGEPDTTANILGPTCKALSALYAPDAPRVTAPPGGDAVVSAVTTGGLWELMVRGQRDTLGMREWLVRVDAVPDPTTETGWALAFRPAYADRVCASPRPDALDLPLEVRELVWLHLPGTQGPRWYWDYWCADPADPHHTIETESGTVLLDERGTAYPYRDEYGVPVLPYSLYHAERTGCLWDPYEWLELVEACLRIGVLWTFFGHLVRNASWPQRYMAGAMVAADLDAEGPDGEETAPRTRVVADPAKVLVLRVDPDAVGQPLVGQWAPASDPAKVAEAIQVYESRAANLAGIDPSSVQKVAGDPRSGYAISVSAEERDANRQRFAPTFRRGDIETLRVCAAVLGSVTGLAYPTRGYGVEYGPDLEAAGGAGDGSVQDTALNGAQVQALVAIVQAVAAGQLPRDAAQAIAVRAFQVTEEEADQLLGSAGRGFVMAPPAASGGGGGGQRPAGDGAPAPADQGGGGAGGGQG